MRLSIYKACPSSYTNALLDGAMMYLPHNLFIWLVTSENNPTNCLLFQDKDLRYRFIYNPFPSLQEEVSRSPLTIWYFNNLGCCGNCIQEGCHLKLCMKWSHSNMANHLCRIHIYDVFRVPLTHRFDLHFKFVLLSPTGTLCHKIQVLLTTPKIICHAPLLKIQGNGVATRVSDVYTRGE